MKKKYVYILVPLIALAVFAGFYINFESGYEARQAQIALDKKKQRDDEIIAQNKLQAKAVADAVEAQKKRKAEKELRDAEESKRQDERQAALQARDKLVQDVATSRDRVERLRKDVAQVKEEIKKIEADRDTLVTQEKFLKDFVGECEANQQRVAAVLTKIAAADAANAAAAKAAAAAAAAKKS